MDNEKFVLKVYNPYAEAWKLIKPLQNLNPKENDAEWKAWVKSIDEFRDRNADNPFALSVYKMLLDAGDVIGKMNE